MKSPCQHLAANYCAGKIDHNPLDVNAGAFILPYFVGSLSDYAVQGNGQAPGRFETNQLLAQPLPI